LHTKRIKMLPSQFRKEQQKKIQARKIKPHRKISNTFIENAITQANGNAIKITFYLASILEKQDIDYSKDLNDLSLDLKDLLKYTDITAHDARRSLKQMQQTSISFINEEKQEELMVNLLPWIDFKWGKNRVEVKLFSKIAKLIIDVKRNYSWINTKVLMKLKNKHSLRMLPILQMIKNFDEDIPKRKRYEIEELNGIFGTSYKRLQDIERFILAPVKEELDKMSDLSFLHEINFSNLGKGRPVATDISIDLIDNAKLKQTNEEIKYQQYIEQKKEIYREHEQQGTLGIV